MQIPSLLATTQVFLLFDGNQSKAPGKRPAAQAQHMLSNSAGVYLQFRSGPKESSISAIVVAG